MRSSILVGTGSGLWRIAGDAVTSVEALTGHTVTALAIDDPTTWAIIDGASIWESRNGRWTPRASLDALPFTCVAPTSAGPLLGTEQAHLYRLTDRLERVDSFESMEGRDAWYTPWGDPADVRSIAAGPDGTLHVNVHVGGVARSRDGGASWTPTLDIETDVHQVLAHPTQAAIVMVAAAEGFGLSRDGGETWQFSTAGLHAHYLRAVAVADDHVLVSASAGPDGRRSALYRKRLEDGTRFERCEAGLPKWFEDNIDTACLAAAGSLVVFGTSDGRVYRSLDTGESWTLVAKGLPPIGCVTLARD